MLYIIFIIIIVLILFIKGTFSFLKRYVMVSIQIRRGPNVIGFGILQPLADGLKLLLKEFLLPLKSKKFLFILGLLLILGISFRYGGETFCKDNSIEVNLSFWFIYTYNTTYLKKKINFIRLKFILINIKYYIFIQIIFYYLVSIINFYFLTKASHAPGFFNDIETFSFLDTKGKSLKVQVEEYTRKADLKRFLSNRLFEEQIKREIYEKMGLENKGFSISGIMIHTTRKADFDIRGSNLLFEKNIKNLLFEFAKNNENQEKKADELLKFKELQKSLSTFPLDTGYDLSTEEKQKEFLTSLRDEMFLFIGDLGMDPVEKDIREVAYYVIEIDPRKNLFLPLDNTDSEKKQKLSLLQDIIFTGHLEFERLKDTNLEESLYMNHLLTLLHIYGAGFKSELSFDEYVKLLPRLLQDDQEYGRLFDITSRFFEIMEAKGNIETDKKN